MTEIDRRAFIGGMISTGLIVPPSLDEIQLELKRRREVADPAVWCQNQLGAHVWSKQREVLYSVRDNQRTSVRSCHSSGKSFIAASAVLWWLKRFPLHSAFVLTTAPTAQQVRVILWREINRHFHKVGIPGVANQSEIKIADSLGKFHIVALGRKPGDLDESAFQGIHAENVLIVLDEACGVPTMIWDAAESIISGGNGRILAIGNPTSVGNEFHKTFKPRSGYHNIHISAFDTPNFTREKVPPLLNRVLVTRAWQERMLIKWGEDSANYKARVLGQFPDRNEFGFFPTSAVEAAHSRSIAPDRSFPILGCDIGGGGDANAFALREGGHIRVIEVNYEPDLEKTGQRIVELIDAHDAIAVVDNVGVGSVPYGIAKARRPNKVFSCVFGDVAQNPEDYANRKAEVYTGYRDRLIEGTIDLDELDEELTDDMAAINALSDPSGRIKIEHKDQIRRRLHRSTDRLDAVVNTFGYIRPHGMPISAGHRDGPRYT